MSVRAALPPRRFSLLEVLVAMSILVVLGTSLMIILRGGVQTWRRSEAKRESYDRAQAVLLQLRDDLTNLVGPVESPLPGLGETESRLVCERDEAGRTRLFLVRSLKAEAEHPITGHAGSSIGSDATLDQRDDLAEARQSRLRATGGAMEVAWVLAQDGVLYRGIRSPIGPPQSLFDPGAFELSPPLPPLVEGQPAPTPTPDAAEPAATQSGPRPALLRPFATEVVYFECLFWSQFTSTWSTRYPALRDPEGDENPGPLSYWDSTRALLRFEGADRREYHTFKAASSLDDPRDDVFPSSVQVTLVLRERLEAGSSTFLAQDVSERDDSLMVEDASRLVRDDDRHASEQSGYVLLDQEWIRFRGVSGNVLQVEQRGARGTVAAAHPAQTEAVGGASFTVVLDVPAWREDWSERRR